MKNAVNMIRLNKLRGGEKVEENISAKNNSIEERLLEKENIIMFTGCLALGFLFNYLFCWKALGVSYPLFILAFYGVLIWSLRKTISFKLDFAWLLSIPILALSLTYFIFSNIIFMVLNFISVPILIFIQTTLLAKKNRYEWYSLRFIQDVIHSIFVKTLVDIPRPFEIFAGIAARKGKSKKTVVTSKVVIGLLISVPLLLLIFMLLSSADQVFQHYTENVFKFLNNINIVPDEALARTFIILVFSFIFFSYFWNMLYSKISEATEKENLAARVTDNIIMITVLISINLVYIFFVVIQFTYLFGGANYALPQSITHSEYARRGFFELVTVTLINLSVLLVSLNFTKKGSKISSRILKILNALLVVCTAIMLYSAHFRMSLYEQAYGYTYLRILTHAFMILIFAFLLAALYKIWSDKFSLVKAYIIIALTAYVILNYVNIDVIISKNNFERYHKTKQIDVGYLGFLSYDAVPWLIELMHDKNKEIAVEAQNILVWKKEDINRTNEWQSFNISKYRAKLQLSKFNLEFQETGHER